MSDSEHNAAGTDADFLLRRKRQTTWTDNVEAKVGIALLLLVFLAIPSFFLIVEKTSLLFYYLGYPFSASLGLYLIYRNQRYWGSLLIILSVYGVVTWLSWLIGFELVNRLKWWIIALLPWVMFNPERRATIIITSALPIVFSMLIGYLPLTPSQLLPAEQEFIRQILRISVALGAFSCIYFLRQHYYDSEKLRVLENEFYSNTLDTIPLPIIIKDGITLDYVFFNRAAQLTYDLRPGVQNSNTSTFSESSAAAVSRLDQEVLRSVTYHIEPDENFVHQTGLHWHFRTYRIPLALKSSGRRLLITVSEDLRALNLVTQKALENKVALAQIHQLIQPLLFRFDIRNAQFTFMEHPQQDTAMVWNEKRKELADYLEYYLTRQNIPDRVPATHRFTIRTESYTLFYGPTVETPGFMGLLLAESGSAVPKNDK